MGSWRFRLRDRCTEYHPRMVALTGSMPEINAVAKRFRVYFSAPEGDDDNYLVDHSLFAYLIGRDGTVRPRLNGRARGLC